jgi:hypothetical protein
MHSEKSLLDWLQWPLLILILVTPLRFALEVAGLSERITPFFSSTAFVFILAMVVGGEMAGHVKKPLSRLFAASFTLGYVNGFMTLIATVLSTYASIETHYRHHSLSMSDAQHVFLRHIVLLPLETSVGACALAAVAFLVIRRLKRFRKDSRSSTGEFS